MATHAWCACATAQPTSADDTPPALVFPTPSPKEDRETELTLRDKRRITGKLVEVTSKNVVMVIGGIPTAFPVGDVETVRLLPSVEDRYAEVRAATRDDDIESLLRLSQWLHTRKRYSLALREIEHVLELEPLHKQAQDLRTLIIEQQRLENVRAAPEQRPAETTKQSPLDAAEPEAVRPKARPRQDPFPLLTEAQMNLVRVYEVDLNDPPRMLIERRTIDTLLDRYSGVAIEGRGSVPVSPEGREQFHNLRANEVLGWMFDLRARELYPQVRVLENPRVLSTFRDDINEGWLVNSCATTKCHGGKDAGRLLLYGRRQGSDPSSLTNFVIVDRFRTSQGLPLIDVGEPSRSILLQAGLPRDRAVFKHPEVSGKGRHWQPVFESERDPRFLQAMRWIQSLYPNRSAYPLDYSPPTTAIFEKATDAEAEEPAPNKALPKTTPR